MIITVAQKIKKLPPIASIKPNTDVNKSKILTPEFIDSDTDDTTSSDGESFEVNSQLFTDPDFEETLIE